MSAEELLNLVIQESNKEAYEELYLSFYPGLLQFAFHKIGNLESAEDIVQDVLLQLWNRRSRIVLIENLNSYLLKAVKYKILDNISCQRYKDIYLKSLEHAMMPYQENTDFKARESSFKSLIDAEIDKLPPRMKESFLLSRNAGLSHQEIANQLGISIHTVSTNIKLALKILKIKLLNTSVLILFC